MLKSSIYEVMSTSKQVGKCSSMYVLKIQNLTEVNSRVSWRYGEQMFQNTLQGIYSTLHLNTLFNLKQ